MGGSTLKERSSFARPGTQDGHRSGTGLIPPPLPPSENVAIPSRTSSLHSRIAQPSTSHGANNVASASASQKALQRVPKTLTHAYMVCGVGREPSQWVRAPPPRQGKIGHMKNAVGQFWLAEILGSSPRLEQDNEIARMLHAAMRACFPHDVEICTGKVQPHCTHHSFVLQQDSQHTLYGIALRVWSRADGKRAETIKDLRRKTETDYYENADETYWIPYCLSFLSRYPLYDLLGDYLRGMWIHWNKATNLFHAEEVSRILSFPAPRLNDLVRIDMKDYALCYQFPSSPTGFQNFSIWPLFTCLSIPNIVGVVEAAVSPTRRIIFVSHYSAMLTIAAEAIRYFVRVYEWSGLYVPVTYARHVTELVQEPGPYILGVTAECRTLFTAPNDALVVDLDRNFVLTSQPPNTLTASQRTKMINRLTHALNGEVATSGVPNHLRSAYGGGKLIPAGQIIVMRGEVESVQDPEWWNQDNVMTVMDHVCEKLGRNKGMKALFNGQVKKPLMTKVSTRHLNEIVRERNQYSRDALEAWEDFINLKARLENEISKVNKRNNFLNDELESWKQQFLKFQAFAEQLSKETQDLKVKIESHKRENRRLVAAIEQRKDDLARITNRLTGTEKQRDDALEALVLQQEIAEELEHDRKCNKKELAKLLAANKNILRQREEAQRVVVHLRSLISGQTHHMEHIVRSMHATPEMDTLTADEDDTASYSPEDLQSVTGSDQSSTRVKLSSSRSIGQLRRLSRNRSWRPFSPSTDGGERLATTPTGDFERNGPPTPTYDRNSIREAMRETPNREKRLSTMSLTDVADRHLRDKTDAIKNIIRSISEQCTAAVESLHLASGTDDSSTEQDALSHKHSSKSLAKTTALSPVSRTTSSIPPTPDLIHPDDRHYRASTAMSVSSNGTADMSVLSSGTRGSLHPVIVDDEKLRGSTRSSIDPVRGLETVTEDQEDSGKGKGKERVEGEVQGVGMGVVA